jgi:hypothetical protein
MSNDWQNNPGGFGPGGDQFQQQQYGQPAYDQSAYAQPPRSWFSRNWWWFIPAIIVVPILGCGGVAAFRFWEIKSSSAYQQALARVQQDPQVQEALGQPIEDATWMPTGEFNVENDRGEASIIFQVAGPKGGAQVSFHARMVGGQWGLTELAVTINSTGERIVIDTSGAADDDEDAPAAGGEAPAWDPEPQADGLPSE